MTPAERRAIGLMVEGSRGPVQDARVAITIRGTHRDPEVMAAIAARHADWVDWLAMTQRHWQDRTRRQSRARHHDSVSTRERYVRCIGSDGPLPAYYIRPYRPGGQS